MISRRHPDPVVVELRALGLGRAAAEKLSSQGTVVRVRDGATLCVEGERGNQAFVILDGTAHVLVDAAVITVGPGSVVGELATLDRSRTRNATVVAAGPLDVLVYDARTFRSLAADPELHDRLAPERAAA